VAAKKKAVKKASAKRSAKKSVKRSVKKSVKKSSAKRSVKKTAKRSAKSSTRYSIPAVPVSGSSRSSVSSISTTPRPSTSSTRSSSASKSSSGSSKAVIIAVVVGILVLAIAVISRNSSSDSTTVTPTPVASESAEPTGQPTEQSGSEPITAYEAPVGIVSIYNETGATVNWKSPAAADGITGYNVELRDNGIGEWKLVATVPATQFSQQITKNDTTGWVQVKVSTVYSDGEVVAGKIHGLPGSWS
jgi:flagellar basal body-associated protein FliL